MAKRAPVTFEKLNATDTLVRAADGTVLGQFSYEKGFGYTARRARDGAIATYLTTPEQRTAIGCDNHCYTVPGARTAARSFLQEG